jgi:23S rRNA pseudouridine2605 synthase
MRKALSTPRGEAEKSRDDGRRSLLDRFRKRPSGGGGKSGGKEFGRKDGGARPERAERTERPTRAFGGGKPSGGGKPAVRVRPRGPHAKHGRPQEAAAPSLAEPMRIAKAMARAGLCSRREAERWIEEGRVSINGRVLKTPAVEVKPGDRVVVDGKPLPVVEPSQLWRYHKPKGTVTTHNDPQGRPTVFDNLPPALPRVISVGRLDFNTEGLILLTNDGELARHLELPATGWLRRYRVRAKGRVTQQDLDKLKDGVEIEGVRYGPVEAQIDTVQGANMWITVGIREGKNREVRKVLSNLGLDVNRLIRISFGPFQLLDLKPGDAEVVKRRVLADQLGPEVAAQFGLVEKADDKPSKGKAQQNKPQQKKRPKRGREDA